jgi:hypothetical protein
MEKEDHALAKSGEGAIGDLCGAEIAPVLPIGGPADDFESYGACSEERSNVLPPIWRPEEPDPLLQHLLEPTLPHLDVLALGEHRATQKR